MRLEILCFEFVDCFVRRLFCLSVIEELRSGSVW